MNHSVTQPTLSHFQVWVIHLLNWSIRSLREGKGSTFLFLFSYNLYQSALHIPGTHDKCQQTFLACEVPAAPREKSLSNFPTCGGPGFDVACAVDHHEVRFPILHRAKSVPTRITGVRRKPYSPSNTPKATVT